MTKNVDVAFELNGRTQQMQVSSNTVLVDVLRDVFGLLGCKVACDQGVCGACTMLVDGVPTTACMTFVFEADGKKLTTIEGLRLPSGALQPIQEAFLATGGFQCGFCTPGMILSVKALLDRDRNPEEATIRDWLSSNICRCTGYEMIIDAVKRAVALYAEDDGRC